MIGSDHLCCILVLLNILLALLSGDSILGQIVVIFIRSVSLVHGLHLGFVMSRVLVLGDKEVAILGWRTKLVASLDLLIVGFSTLGG